MWNILLFRRMVPQAENMNTDSSYRPHRRAEFPVSSPTGKVKFCNVQRDSLSLAWLAVVHHPVPHHHAELEQFSIPSGAPLILRLVYYGQVSLNVSPVVVKINSTKTQVSSLLLKICCSMYVLMSRNLAWHSPRSTFHSAPPPPCTRAGSCFLAFSSSLLAKLRRSPALSCMTRTLHPGWS